MHPKFKLHNQKFMQGMEYHIKNGKSPILTVFMNPREMKLEVFCFSTDYELIERNLQDAL